MLFDPENHVNKLCAEGMQREGEGKPLEALSLFELAWEAAVNDAEKFIAAHYVARHQNSVTKKLEWDTIALSLARKIDTDEMKALYPSLYLNVAKCYEDLGNLEEAKINYRLAHTYAAYLPKDGYGNMIKAGIINGIERVSNG